MEKTVITTTIYGDKDTAAEALNRAWGMLPHTRPGVVDSDVSVDRPDVAERAQEMWDESNHNGRW